MKPFEIVFTASDDVSDTRLPVITAAIEKLPRTVYTHPRLRAAERAALCIDSFEDQAPPKEN